VAGCGLRCGPRCITQPGHAKELFFNKGVQGFGGAVRSLQGLSFQQGTEDRMIGIWEDYNMNINCLVVTGTMEFYDFPYIGNNNPN